MPNAKFVPFDSVEHQERRPGVVLSSLVDGDAGATQISSGVAEFAIGASAPMHYHDAEESVIDVEGEGLMVIDGQEHIVHSNDAAFISPGAHHSIANHGNQPFKVSWTYASINWSTTPVE